MMVSICWLLRTLCKSLNVLSYAALSSLSHCPSTFRLLFSLNSPFVYFKFFTGLCLHSSCLKAVSGAIIGPAHLFSMSQGLLSLLAWCSVSWKPLFHILFRCFRQEGKSVSVTPFWWDADVWSGEWKFSSLRYELGEDQFESINFMAQQSERELTVFQYNYMSNWRLGELKWLSRCDPCTRKLLLSRKSDGGLGCTFLAFWHGIWKDKMKRTFFACRVHEN